MFAALNPHRRGFRNYTLRMKLGDDDDDDDNGGGGYRKGQLKGRVMPTYIM